MKTEQDSKQYNDEWRERLSALADGELPQEAHASMLETGLRDESALEHWAAYHRIGDVLRGGSALAGRGDELAFLATFRERMAADVAAQAVEAAAKSAAAPRESEGRAAMAQVLAFPAAVAQKPQATAPATARTAANDGVYRWKMVAGLATVMAVLVVGWTALDESALAPSAVPQQVVASQPAQESSPASTVDRGAITLASSVPGAGDRVAEPAGAGSAVALLPRGEWPRSSQPGLFVERGVGGGAVGSRYALQAANDGLESVMIRDPRLDEFLAAHRQGNASALQTPVDFVRDVVVQPAP